jgi:ferredoxin-NADP reductase
MKYIDRILNHITMYRLLLYGLIALLVTAIFGAFIGQLSFSPYGLIVSAAILVGSCYLANRLFAAIYGVASTAESSLITGLILFCIFSPPTSWLEAVELALVAAIAMASKYLLAYRQRLIFNPAAIAAVIVSLLGLGSASWWIANQYMTVFVVILGLLVLRKIRHYAMFTAFLIATLSVILVKHSLSGDLSLVLLKGVALSWPLVFMGTIMLTEPLTMPPRYRLQLIYGAIVGVIFAAGLHVGPVYGTPEVALVLGNVFSYATVIRQRLHLRLQARQELRGGIYELLFVPDRPFHFQAGQYAELVMPMPHIRADSRGNRRSFTIASAPTEPTIRIAMKFSIPSSSFKTSLAAMQVGDYLYGSQIAGEFLLPKDPTTKLLFIAGGIGITPFRSMLQYLIDSQQQRDIALLYVASDSHAFIYSEVLQAAAQYGLKTVYILSAPDIPPDWRGESGNISKDLLIRTMPDYKDRHCYISGPNQMVMATRKTLTDSGVKRGHIRTDYFSGY